MGSEITIRHIPDQWVVSTRGRVPESAIPDLLGRSFGAIFGYLGRLGIEATGHPFVIYHEFGAGAIDAEVCAPIATEIAPEIRPDGEIGVRLLAGGPVAQTLHVGPYEELARTYDGLTAWIRDNGHEVSGPVCERYLTGIADGVDPATYRTEIEMPIEEAATAAVTG